MEAAEEQQLEVVDQLGLGAAEPGADVVDPGPVPGRHPRDEGQQALETLVGAQLRHRRFQPLTISARSSGGPEHLGVVEEAEDEGPEGVAVGDPHGQHHRPVGPPLLDRVGADVAGRPRGLAGVDQQAGGQRLLGAHLPGRRLGAGVRRALEGALVTGDLHVGLDPVEAEHAAPRRRRGRGRPGTSGRCGTTAARGRPGGAGPR